MVMFALFCNAPTVNDKSQKEDNVEGVLAISECQAFNAAIMNAHIEFTKLQPKQQPRKDDGGPSFRPTLALG